MRLNKLKLALASVLLMAAHGAQALEFRPILGYEFAAMSGSVKDGADRLVIKRDLGIDDASNVIAGFQIGAVGQYFRFRYVPYSFSGSTTTSRTYEFAGETFAANAGVKSRIELNEYAVDYYFVPLNTPLFYLGAGVGGSQFEVDTQIGTGGMDAHSSEKVLLPRLGLTGGVKFPLTDVSINADLARISYGDNSYSNMDLNVDYTPYPLMGLRLGYRNRDLKFTSGDVEVDLGLTGPYLSIWLGF